VTSPEVLKSWNSFLGAELSVKKGRTIHESLDLSEFDWHDQIIQHPDLTDVERRRLRSLDFDRLKNSSTQVLREADFPEALAECPGLPPGLLYQGCLEAFSSPCIAIVGTRSATSYGRVCARKFAEEFARAGITVISGGAVGIDAAAHEGALSVNGRTGAVLACGVDNIYPSSHAGLFQQIQRDGFLVSQYALGSKPADYKFIQRNVLIAALSLAVVVIEAPQKSGAIRTAGFAADFGREVFVIPGQIDSFGFQGSHALIRDGATLVDHPAQILESLGISSAPKISSQQPQGVGGQILATLNAQSKSVEKIVELTGLATSDVLSELTMLELDGLVLREAGGFAKAL
jgi:DNA processing protein